MHVPRLAVMLAFTGLVTLCIAGVLFGRIDADERSELMTFSEIDAHVTGIKKMLSSSRSASLPFVAVAGTPCRAPPLTRVRARRP